MSSPRKVFGRRRSPMSPIGRAIPSAPSTRTSRARTNCSTRSCEPASPCSSGASRQSLADVKAGAAASTYHVGGALERELDRMAAAENAVPERWWRLLYEYRAYTATDPAARAELADAERLCREILARYIERFLAAFGIVPPLPPIELAELSTALTDGLRAAHADGRSRMTSGEGLRLLVKLLIESASAGRVGLTTRPSTQVNRRTGSAQRAVRRPTWQSQPAARQSDAGGRGAGSGRCSARPDFGRPGGSPGATRRSSGDGSWPITDT